MSPECWSARGPLANRLTRYAATTPSSVFPAAMPIEVASDPAVVRLTKKAPTKTAGQTRTPSSRNAARAIPVGGQTVVALTCTNASRRPSLPATK